MSFQFNFYIYGLGKFTDVYFPVVKELIELTGINFLGFIDKRYSEYPDGYDGYGVYNSEIIKDNEFNKIAIFAYTEKEKGVYEKLYSYLVNELNIDREKICNITGILRASMEAYRKCNYIACNRKPKIYDCFTFYDELDILKIRMEMLSEYVDYFVIVEMEKDHHGRKKELVFHRNSKLFEKYREKIIYVCPKEIPKYNIKDANSDGWVWVLEQFQRRCITRGLKEAEGEDIVLISDCDEIPKPEIIKTIRDGMDEPYPNYILSLLNEQAIALRQEYYYYYFNCKNRVRKNTTTIVKYKNLINPQIIRALMNCLPYIDFGGWHLTYFGGEEKVKRKIKSIVEGIDVSDKDITERMESAIDIYGRTGYEFELDFVEKDKISIPNIDYWINKFPHLYRKKENEK